MLTSAARVLRGLNWLIQTFDSDDMRGKPRIINLSLGFDRELVHQELRRDVDARFKKHIEGMRLILNQASVTGEAMIFAAIGNGGAGRAGYPALFESVFGIGAVDFDGKVAGFSGSNFVKPGQKGPEGLPAREKPDFFGYGHAVRSCLHRDCDGGSHYETLSGSSMASPYAGAIAALYLSRQPNLTADELRDVLSQSGLPVDGHGGRLVRYDPAIAASL